MDRRRGMLLGSALVAAALLDTVWVAAFALPVGLRWPWFSFSGLEADDRPWAWLFRGGFVAADVLVVAAAAVALTARDGRSGYRRAVWLGLGVFGLASIADDLAGMTCVPHVDPGCRLTVLPAGAPWVDQLHTMASVLAALGLLASMAAASRVRRPAAGWLVAELATTLATGMCILLAGPTAIPQTAELLTEASWLAVLGWWAARSSGWSVPGYAVGMARVEPRSRTR